MLHRKFRYTISVVEFMLFYPVPFESENSIGIEWYCQGKTPIKKSFGSIKMINQVSQGFAW